MPRSTTEAFPSSPDYPSDPDMDDDPYQVYTLRRPHERASSVVPQLPKQPEMAETRLRYRRIPPTASSGSFGSLGNHFPARFRFPDRTALLESLSSDDESTLLPTQKTKAKAIRKRHRRHSRAAKNRGPSPDSVLYDFQISSDEDDTYKDVTPALAQAPASAPAALAVGTRGGKPPRAPGAPKSISKSANVDDDVNGLCDSAYDMSLFAAAAASPPDIDRRFVSYQESCRHSYGDCNNEAVWSASTASTEDGTQSDYIKASKQPVFVVSRPGYDSRKRNSKRYRRKNRGRVSNSGDLKLKWSDKSESLDVFGKEEDTEEIKQHEHMDGMKAVGISAQAALNERLNVKNVVGMARERDLSVSFVRSTYNGQNVSSKPLNALQRLLHMLAFARGGSTRRHSQKQ